MRETLKTLKIRFPKKAKIKSIMPEFQEYMAIRRLMPDAAWENYRTLGIRDLTEIKLMNKAIKALRKGVKENG